MENFNEPHVKYTHFCTEIHNAYTNNLGTIAFIFKNFNGSDKEYWIRK
jgi:hypothetical protein